jgi:hypothetical protein
VGDWGQSPLPIADEYKRPFVFRSNQTSPDRILANILKFFRFAFVVAQSVIEETSLPSYLRDACRDSFEIAKQLGKLCVTGKPRSAYAGDLASVGGASRTIEPNRDSDARSRR